MLGEKNASMLPTDSSYPNVSTKPSRSNRSRWLLAGVIAGTMVWGLLPASFIATSGTSKWFSGDGIIKEGPISWYDCGDDLKEYKCADVAVPLDYLHPEKGNASVAMIIYPTQARDRQGSIFTNPGGPGGSGVSFISRIGPELQLLTGGKHDIVGFDPRGIGKTKPRFRCLTNQTQEDLYVIRAKTYSSVWPHGNLSDPSTIAELEKQLVAFDAQDEVIGGACEDPEGAGPYMSTAHVVRDIEYLSTLLEGSDAPINYWGFSYGTTVGTYLTAMFPDRMGKVIIDAVMAVETWYSQPHLATSAELYLVGFEDSWETFLDECAKAGPGRCALATSKNTTAAEISQRVDDLLESLYKRPLPVIKFSKPGLLIRGHVLDQMRMFMYKPRNWPLLAQQLVEVMHGNGSAIYEAQTTSVQLNSTIESDTRWAGARVGCSDQVPWHVAKEDRVPTLLKQTITDVTEYTRHFGGGMMEICWNWESGTSERFAGPLQSKLSNPMLIIGNKHDSICPLFNAQRIHDQVKDSRLIVQNTAGHCSIAFTSLCTIKTVQSYFVNNMLFDDTIVCEADETLFPSSDGARFGSGEAEVFAEVMGKVMDSQLESM